jgi:D-3-phosphoglycerate dehydrogenase
LICTPHLGASSYEAQNRVAVDIADQIVNFVRQSKLEGGVNFDKLKNKQIN